MTELSKRVKPMKKVTKEEVGRKMRVGAGITLQLDEYQPIRVDVAVERDSKPGESSIDQLTAQGEEVFSHLKEMVKVAGAKYESLRQEAMDAMADESEGEK